MPSSARPPAGLRDPQPLRGSAHQARKRDVIGEDEHSGSWDFDLKTQQFDGADPTLSAGRRDFAALEDAARMGGGLTRRIRNGLFRRSSPPMSADSRFGNAVPIAWRVARVTNWDPTAWVGHDLVTWTDRQLRAVGA